MIFFLVYIAVALLIVAGYLEFPIFSEGLSLPEHFSLFLLVFYLAANMFRFAPLYPLLLALIRGLTNFRLPRGLAIVLAGLAGLFGFVFTLLILAFSGAGGELVFMHGITLTVAVCASLLLLSPKQGVECEFFRLSWFLLMVPASAAVWSLVSAGEVVQSANRIAGDHPFCLARHTGSTTPIRTFAQLRGFSFFTNASGYKSTSRWYFHGLLIVQGDNGGEFYNWSPRNMRFDRIPRPSKMLVSPIGACNTTKDFWGTLSIF